MTNKTKQKQNLLFRNVVDRMSRVTKQEMLKEKHLNDVPLAAQQVLDKMSSYQRSNKIGE